MVNKARNIAISVACFDADLIKKRRNVSRIGLLPAVRKWDVDLPWIILRGKSFYGIQARIYLSFGIKHGLEKNFELLNRQA